MSHTKLVPHIIRCKTYTNIHTLEIKKSRLHGPLKRTINNIHIGAIKVVKNLKNDDIEK